MALLREIAPGRRRATLAVALGLAVAGATAADQTQPTLPSGVQEQFLPDNVRAAAAATAVVGVGFPPTVAGVLVRGHETSAWLVEAPASPARPSPDVAPVLDPEVLANIDDRAPIADPDVNPDEVRAYYYTVLAASKTPTEELFKKARRDLNYVHLFEDTKEYRGQLVYVEGRLKRLWRFEPNRQLKREGVKDCYEGWMINARYEAQALSHCVLFTELPPGVKPGENVDYPIRFAGYLFKRYRVRSGKTAFDAPLLIGRTVELVSERPASSGAAEARQGFLIAFVAVVGSTAAVIVGLAWWYKRNDQRIRQRIAQARPPDFGENADQVPTNGRVSG